MTEEIIPIDTPIVAPPKKSARVEMLEARMEGMEQAIGLLSRAIQELGKGLQTTPNAGATPSLSEPILNTAPASNSNNDFLRMMQAFMQMQTSMLQNMNLMKQGAYQDLLNARQMIEAGSMLGDEDDGEEDVLESALAPLVKQYLNRGNSGSAGYPSPSPPPAPTPLPTSAVLGNKAVDLSKPQEDDEE